MKKHVSQFIVTSESKALATYAEGKVNVVPVSSIKVMGDDIWLIDYFMEKTSENIKKNPGISLVCWKDMMGYQLKGLAIYESEGERYKKACEWIAPIHPDRIVKGLIVFTPLEVFDIAPAKNTGEQIKGLMES